MEGTNPNAGTRSSSSSRHTTAAMLFAFVCACSCAALTNAFLLPVNPQCRAYSYPPRDRLAMRIHGRVLAGTINDLLTVRSIDTVFFYLEELRDHTTRDWLKNFSDYKAQGLGSRGWRAFLHKLISAEEEKIVVKYRPQSPRGASRKYAYTKKVELFTYQVTINPRDVARRILGARRQLATEWIADLQCIKKENEEVRKFVRNMKEFDINYAQQHRKKVFEYNPEDPSNSPHRATNYNEVNKLITNLAIEDTRSALSSTGLEKEALWFDWFIAQTDGMTAFDRLRRLLVSYRQGYVSIPSVPPSSRRDKPANDPSTNEGDKTAPPKAITIAELFYQGGKLVPDSEKDFPLQGVDSKEVSDIFMQERVNIANMFKNVLESSEDQEYLESLLPAVRPVWEQNYASPGAHQIAGYRAQAQNARDKEKDEQDRDSLEGVIDANIITSSNNNSTTVLPHEQDSPFFGGNIEIL